MLGWDLAADEGAHPLHKHLPGLQRAVELGVPATVHAGEWGSGNDPDANRNLCTKLGHYDTLPNIRLAVEEGSQRLGHGLTMFMDGELMRVVAEKRVIVECCVTSNVKRITGYHEHPIVDMIRAGVQCTINTDNRFLGGTTSTQEVLHAVQDVGLSWGEVKDCLVNGAKGSFYWQIHGCTSERDDWVSDFEEKIDQALQESSESSLNPSMSSM